MPEDSEEAKKAAVDAIVKRAESSSRELRNPSMPPNKALREAASASADIGVLLLRQLTRLEGEMDVIKQRLERQEEKEDHATNVLVAERMSKIGLEEEITRTDLNLKRLKFEHWSKMTVRILAFIMTPPGVWAIYKWVASVLTQ